MKMKEFGPPGGGPSLAPPLRSANGQPSPIESNKTGTVTHDAAQDTKCNVLFILGYLSRNIRTPELVNEIRTRVYIFVNILIEIGNGNPWLELCSPKTILLPYNYI